MRVLVTTAYTPPQSAVPEFHAHAARDRFREHQLTEDPDEADVILFVDARADQNDWRMRALRDHALTQRFPGKVFVYCEMDQPWCGMPGLYTSMPRPHFDRRRQRACGYHILRLGEAMAAQTVSFTGDPKWLFSFMGRSLPGPREAVLALRDERALIEDTSRFNFFDGQPAAARDQERKYQDVILTTKFVLCPSGAGPSSIRLFETLGAGRVPVIISDDWVEVDGPDWNACSVRVPESQIGEIPAKLAALEPQWPALAAAAREAWSEWFAPDVVFHRLVEACGAIQRGRREPAGGLPSPFNRRYARLWLREAKSRWRLHP